MRGHNIAGLIIVIVGLSILFRFPFFNILFAIILLWIGIRMMSRDYRFDNYKGHINVKTDKLEKTFIFSPVNKVIVSDNFSGGNITCIFAGGQIDLSGVKTSKKEVDLEITNIFAGLKVILPKGWKVNSEETTIIGGVDDKTGREGNVTVNLKGSSIFGGMEFVN